MDFRSASGGCEEDGDEAEMGTVRNIWYNGASTVHWGIFVVDVSGEYNKTLGPASSVRSSQGDVERDITGSSGPGSFAYSSRPHNSSPPY